MKKSQNKLIFKIAVKDSTQAHFSLNKVNADFAHNQIVLNSIIGTLVKYGASGKIEPYLAERWTESSDKRKWSFQLRPHLFSEDGEAITGERFVEVLASNLKEYSTRGSVIMFDHLDGWSDFIQGKSHKLTGLTFKENNVAFSFDHNPGDFLELLRMPYFGLWIEKNNRLISTSAYRLDQFTTKKISLSLREKWFTISQDSIPHVEISFESLGSEIHQNSSLSIVRYPFYTDIKDSEEGYWIISPPTRLESFVLSPYKNSFFKNMDNRRVFRNRIKNLYPKVVGTNFFYQSAKSMSLVEDDLMMYKASTIKDSTPLEFAIRGTNYSDERLENLKKIIQSALEGSGKSFEIVLLETRDANWIQRNDLNTVFDSRVAFVDIGGYPEWAVLKMMFCSKLGINFPDPSGKICDLVSKGITASKDIDQVFIDQFNQILYDDAVVVPIQHHADKWFVTNDINPKSLPPTTLYPQFELIRTR